MRAITFLRNATLLEMTTAGVAYTATEADPDAMPELWLRR